MSALIDVGIVTCEGLEDVFKDLAKKGLLKAEVYDSIAVCGESRA